MVARLSLLSGWVLLLLAAAPSPAFAEEGKAQLRAEPLALRIGQGQVEELRLLLTNAHNVYGIDLQASYDPAVVEVADDDPQREGVQMTAGRFLKPEFVARNEADNQRGTLRYVVTQLNPTPPANGEGVVLSIHFRGKMTGSKAKLIFTAVQIADRQGNKLPVTALGADLVVVSPKQPTRTPVPTSTPAPTSTRPPTRTPKPTRTARIVPVPSATATPTSTRSRLLPTFTPRPSRTKTPTLSPQAVETAAGPSNSFLTALTVGGFSGAGLLFILTAGRHLTRKRRFHE